MSTRKGQGECGSARLCAGLLGIYICIALGVCHCMGVNFIDPLSINNSLLRSHFRSPDANKANLNPNVTFSGGVWCEIDITMNSCHNLVGHADLLCSHGSLLVVICYFFSSYMANTYIVLWLIINGDVLYSPSAGSTCKHPCLGCTSQLSQYLLIVTRSLCLKSCKAARSQTRVI